MDLGLNLALFELILRKMFKKAFFSKKNLKSFSTQISKIKKIPFQKILIHIAKKSYKEIFWPEKNEKYVFGKL